MRHREVKWQVRGHKAKSPGWDMNSGLEDAHLYCELLRLGGGGHTRAGTVLCAYPYLAQAPRESTCSVGGLWRLLRLP